MPSMDESTYFQNIASYKLLAKKEVGQNFLVDAKAAKDIVDALNIQEGENVLEIGCGAGSLTYFLAQSKGKITSIDIDEAMIAKTSEDFKGFDNVSVIYGNATKFDYSGYDKIIGNLPYYITSLIIEKTLLGAEKAKRMVFMVQKEAGERIDSKVGSKDYSPLTVLLRLFYETRKVRNVGRSSFVPIPHVESAVYAITPKSDISLSKAQGVYLLTKALFLQRRKTLRNNLKGTLGDETKTDEALKACGLSPTLRPEEVSPQGFLALYLYLNH